MDSFVRAAARNNAHWCGLVCRSHGVATRFDRDAWVALTRSPTMYPDAVTLDPAVDPANLMPRIDRSPRCSVKDSLASLDLAEAGFEVLFDAEWIYRAPPERAGGPAGWTAVSSPNELSDWALAHGGGAVFRPELIADPDVVIVAASGEEGPVAGAIGNRSDGVVGISNLFTTIAPDLAWAGAVAAIADRFPGYPLVGYESGDDLAAAHAAGFASIGPLRVWLRP
jgi:hypothetical protein